MFAVCTPCPRCSAGMHREIAAGLKGCGNQGEKKEKALMLLSCTLCLSGGFECSAPWALGCQRCDSVPTKEQKELVSLRGVSG